MQKTYLQQMTQRSGASDVFGTGAATADPTDLDLGFTEAQQAAVAQMESHVDAQHQEIVKIGARGWRVLCCLTCCVEAEAEDMALA